MSTTHFQVGEASHFRPVIRTWVAIAVVIANLALPMAVIAQAGGTQGGFSPPAMGGGQSGAGSNSGTQGSFPGLPPVTAGQGTAPATQVPGATPSMLYPSEDFH